MEVQSQSGGVIKHYTSVILLSLSLYLHDAPQQDAQDVRLQQRAPQTHSTCRLTVSAFLLSSVLLSFPPVFLSSSIPSAPSRVLLPLPPVPVLLLPAPPLLLHADGVHGVAHVDEAGSGHEHDLQHLAGNECV